MVELIKKKNEKSLDWKNLRFNVPIMESFRNELNEFMIKGVAINSVTTRNNVFYPEEELQKGTSSLINVPILKDHNNSVDSIVGRTKDAQYDVMAKNIKFEGRISDEGMQRKIEQGDITAVSVGAMVSEIEKTDEESDVVSVKGITFVELSLVAVPADPGAGFARAVAESFELKQKLEDDTEDIEELEEVIEEKAVPIMIKKVKNINIHAKLGDKAKLSIPR